MVKVGISEISAIESFASGNKDYISLAQGALKVGGVPKEIKDHLKIVLNTDKTDYYQSAWGIEPLREKIAEHLSKLHKVKINSKKLLVTHGCMGAISILLFSLLEQGDEVILPEPTYPAYKNIVSVARGKVVYAPGKALFDCDVEVLEKFRTKKTKVLMFSNPCNPTGKTVPKKVLESLIEWCDKNRIYLIVDEAYDDYIFDGEFCSITPYVNRSEFVIRTGSFSKSLSMSGWRMGYMVVPDSIAQFLAGTQDAVLNCPNVIAQHAVLYALDHQEHWKKFSDIVRKSRDIAVLMLQDLVKKNIISFEKPDAGFFIFFKTKEKDSYNLTMKILQEANVGLVPGRAFGPSGAPFIRLCYARLPEVVLQGTQRVIKVLDV